jgi:deoxyribonuclease V
MIDDETIRKAATVQLLLRERAEDAPPALFRPPLVVAGLDASYADGRIYAAAAAMTCPGLDAAGSAGVVRRVVFPYIPGLFAFREGPALLRAVKMLDTAPDLLLVHGHGAAHPRRFGMATHIGLLLDIPSIGVAGRPMEPPGVATPVSVREEGRPVWVSAGYRTTPAVAVAFARAMMRDHRFPEPLAVAHRLSRELRAAARSV